MSFMHVLMSLIYSLRCPFPLIYIQHISCVELWPWRRGGPLKDKAVKNSQVKRREEREGQKWEDRRVVNGHMRRRRRGEDNQSTETWKMRNYGANKSEAGGEMRVWEKNRKEG